MKIEKYKNFSRLQGDGTLHPICSGKQQINKLNHNKNGKKNI